MNKTLIAALSLVLVSTAHVSAQEKGFAPLFNGHNLDGWMNVNCAPETWSVKGGKIHCTGKPIGELRTTRMYENFVLELEWRHLKSGGNAGVFAWPDRSVRRVFRSCARWRCRCSITVTSATA